MYFSVTNYCSNIVIIASLTLMKKVASSSPIAGRLTQPSISLWVCKMSTWWMMVIGGMCAIQIDLLGNKDMAAIVLYAPQGVDLRGGGSSCMLPRELI